MEECRVMKIILAAAAALSLAVPALALGAGGVVLTNPEFTDGFNTPGECDSALAKVRDNQSKNPAMRSAAYRELSEAEYLKESLRTTRCEMVEGRYRVVFYVNGIPG